VLQYRVVTPQGEYLTSNACQNTDLFYALRGGGGGTFGVVMESTFLAEPRPMTIQVYVKTFSFVFWDFILRYIQDESPFPTNE
jgi:FAD/FMN-containing dehydrogenase